MSINRYLFVEFLKILDDEALKEKKEKIAKIELPDGSIVTIEVTYQEDRKRLSLVKSG